MTLFSKFHPINLHRWRQPKWTMLLSGQVHTNYSYGLRHLIQHLSRWNDSKVSDEVFQPYCLCRCFACWYVFWFTSWISYNLLLGTFPCHCSTIQGKYQARMRAEIISISLKPHITIPCYSQVMTPTDIRNVSLVLHRYLRMFLTTVQWALPGFPWYLLTMLKAKATTGLVHVIAYMIEQTAEA